MYPKNQENTYQLLKELSISYTEITHPSISTMEELEDISVKLGVEISKNLLLCNRQETKFYLLVLPANKRFKTKDLSHQINSSRLSFAKDHYMKEYLDILPGSLSLLGLMNDKDYHVQLLIDEDVLKQDYIGLHPCQNTSSLKIKKEDILERFLPYVHHDYITVIL